MDLTEAEDIKKRWQQYTELYKKALETSLVVQWLRLCGTNAGSLGSIPGSGRSPGEGNGTPFQYSCLENPMDGGAW